MKNRKELIGALIENLHTLVRHVAPGRERAIDTLGLNRAQLGLLFRLSRNKEVTVSLLAEKFNTTPGAVTQLIDGLITKNYIRRVKEDADKRVVKICFTDEGKEKFGKLKETYMKSVTSVFDVLSDEELDALIVIQKKLLDRLALERK